MVSNIPIDKKKRAKRSNKWNKEHMKRFTLVLHKDNDEDLIKHIDENKPVSTYLKKLVVNDMESTKKD